MRFTSIALGALLFVASLYLPAQGWAAWTLVQQVAIANTGTCGPTCTADFPSNTTANNLIIIVAQWPESAKTIGSCSGDAATTWTVASGTIIQDAGLNRSAGMCYGVANGGNTASITWSPSGGFQYSAIAFEYSGNATTNILDQQAAGSGTGTNVTVGNVTTDTNGELLVIWGVKDDADATGWTKATNWTAVQFSCTSNACGMADYQGFTPSGTTELYITRAVSGTWVASGATFRPLVSTGVSTAIPLFGR
jgi:hypothetical protein